jgi:hypothetical protein
LTREALIAAQKATVGLNVGAKGSVVTGSKRDPVKDDKPTLAEAGIDKHLADRARKLEATDLEEQTLRHYARLWRTT